MRNEREIREIAAFFRKLYFPAKQWDWKNLLVWLSWYDRGSGLLVCRWGRRIKGIAICRTISEAQQGFEEYCFDPKGKIVWVQFIASQYLEVTKTLGRKIKGHFPDCEKVAFSREKNGSELKVYDINKIAKKIS